MSDPNPIPALVVPLLVVAALVLLLRWTWSRGRSLAPRQVRRGSPHDYGLLVSVAEPQDAGEAARLSAQLDAAGIRHTLVHTTQGPRLMVFESDTDRARAALH